MASTNFAVLEPLKQQPNEKTHFLKPNLTQETVVAPVEGEEQRVHNSHVTVTNENQLRALQCVAQSYAWGRLGSTSTVARMKEAQAMQEKGSEFSIDESVPYAELWIGTHPSGMSTVIVNDEQKTLLEYVESDPQLHCGRKEWTDLTFLFKVLSISKVLSIQAHPDKTLAERLHAASPHNYKDANHKPEMAIALSDQVQAMVGFRPIVEIAEHIQAYPEFRGLLGDRVADEVTSLVHSPATRDVLQHMFKAFLECPEETVQAQLTCLLDRLKSTHERDEVQNLIVSFSEQFPGDSGIIAPLMLTLLHANKEKRSLLAPTSLTRTLVASSSSAWRALTMWFVPG
jgi:mannose-6-phosphate isomerase